MLGLTPVAEVFHLLVIKEINLEWLVLGRGDMALPHASALARETFGAWSIQQLTQKSVYIGAHRFESVPPKECRTITHTTFLANL